MRSRFWLCFLVVGLGMSAAMFAYAVGLILLVLHG